MNRTNILIIIMTALLIILACIFFSPKAASNTKKEFIKETRQQKNIEYAKNQQICPQAWFDNTTPTTENEKVSGQYIILDGKSFPPDAIDEAWVKANCDVKGPIVIFE